LDGALVPVNKTGISTKRKKKKNKRNSLSQNPPKENRVQYNFIAISGVPAIFLSSGPFLLCLA